MINAYVICTAKKRPNHRGFTLVEILIVLGIFSVLAAVALPIVRKMVSEQKGANTSRALSAFIDSTRRRAIAEGRPMGIMIERLNTTAGALSPDRCVSIRVRQMAGVPSYSGETADATATLLADATWPAVGTHPGRMQNTHPDPVPGIDTALFDANDNQLLFLTARMLANNEANPPIRIGDPIEFPGGRVAAISRIVLDDPLLGPVRVNFDLEENLQWNQSPTSVSIPVATQSFPSATRTFGAGQQVAYKIHRRPSRSTTAPLDLPRGLVIDLNYSGMGAYGNEFAPFAGIVNNHIVMTFGEDGRVASLNTSAGTVVAPTGLIFLCVGDADGVRDDSLLSTEMGAVANLMNLKSIWVVINPSTGRVVSSPFASVTPPSGTPAPLNNPHAFDGNGVPYLGSPINQARSFAFLSDTVDNK